MSGANPRDVHEGEAEGRVQSPSHHLARTDSPASGPVTAPLQDPEGNPAVGAAEDKSGQYPSTRTSPSGPLPPGGGGPV